MFLDKNNTENDSNSLFDGINKELLKQYLNPKNTIGKKEGDIIYQKGDPAEYMYLILDGEVKLKLTSPDGTNNYIVKSSNNFFGETELLSKTARKSSAVADTGCRLITLNLAELKALIKADKKILKNLYSNKTFEMSDEDFNESTKHFINIDANLEDLSKTTEKFSIDSVNEEPGENIPFAGPEEEEHGVNIDDETFISTEPVNNISELIEEQISETRDDGSEENISFSDILEEESIEITEPTNIVNPNENEEENLPVETETPPGSSLILDDDTIIIDEEIPKIPGKEKPVQEIEVPVQGKKEPLKETEEPMPEIQKQAQEIEEVPAEEKNIPTFDDIGFSDTIEILPDEPLHETYTSDYVEEKVIDEIEKETEKVQQPDYYHRIINSIEKIFSKTTLDETSDIIAEAACELLNTGGGVLYVLNNEHSELIAKLLVDNSIDTVKLKVDDCLQGTSVKEKKYIIVNDPAAEEKFGNPVAAMKGMKSHNALYFPILSKHNEVKALLELFNSEKGNFTSNDIELLEIISPAILQAIQNSQLIEINQNQNNISSIGKISNFLAEDLKNPLLIIKHYAESLKKKNLPEDVKKIFDLLVKEINAGEDFLKNILSFVHKKNITEMKSVSLSESLNEVIDLLAEYVESRNNVIFKKLEADATVNLDIRQFFIACYQVVKNACDTMPDNGKIFITTEMDGDYIKVKIKDNGIGIPESRKGDIFKPFTTWGKKNHAGLGLSIADKIISDHGGYILLDSVVGSGATFIIALPVIF